MEEKLEEVMKTYSMTEDEAKEFMSNQKEDSVDNEPKKETTEDKVEDKSSAEVGEKTTTDDKTEDKVENVVETEQEPVIEKKEEDKVETTISETEKQIDNANQYNYESVVKELDKVKELNASYIARIEKLESIVNEWGLADTENKSFGLETKMKRDGKADKGYDPIKHALECANRK